MPRDSRDRAAMVITAVLGWAAALALWIAALETWPVVTQSVLQATRLGVLYVFARG